jgi:chaperone modulatory protein CbpM
LEDKAMSKEIEKIFQGKITEEESDISLVQLCRYCEMEPDHIIELVTEGILEPRGESKHEWHFSFITIERVKKVQRLRSDFDLTVPGVGLVMDLLDQIERLEELVEKYSR